MTIWALKSPRSGSIGFCCVYLGSHNGKLFTIHCLWSEVLWAEASKDKKEDIKRRLLCTSIYYVLSNVIRKLFSKKTIEVTPNMHHFAPKINPYRHIIKMVDGTQYIPF